MARGTCVEIGKTTAHRKRYISKSTTFSNGGVSAVCQEQPQKSCVKTTIFFQKFGKEGPNFPKKWGNRITIPDNLIVYISQSIGDFHETSQIFARAEMITSNDQKRDDHFKRPKARSHWMSYGKRKGTCVEIGKTTALKACA